MDEYKLKIDEDQLSKIKSQFEQLGITPSEYPKYSDANEFGKNFKICTVLKEVPLITTGSSINS